jgi:riboflavin kinase / FMN adenylyltransferase
MELVRGLHNLRPNQRGGAVAMGNFDGVHLGHQALVAAARRAVGEVGSTVVLTFEPHPREVLDPAGAPRRLMPLATKARILATLGVNRVVVLRFDDRLRKMTPAAFAADVLRGALGADHVVVGEGFRYGAARAGTVETLCAAGLENGFGVVTLPAVSVGDERVSSTRVRTALESHDLRLVGRLLGRGYTLAGRVVRGQQLGRDLGYPTANLRLHPRAPHLRGIYAVRVRGVPGVDRWLDAVASLGTRPTVGGVEPLLEVHVFDFEGDLYGRRLEVEFVERLRDELRFESLAALVEQMHSDAERAREILAVRAA